VRFVSDPHLDAMTRSWIFDALRDISGERFGDDPRQWREWYASISGQQQSAEDHGSLLSVAWLHP